MRPIRTALLVAIATAAVYAATSEAAKAPAVSFRLTPLSSIRFPDRAFVVTTSKPFPLTGGSVRVTENGQVVNRLSVVPASQTLGRTFGVMLALDTSNSMKGRAIAGAVAAARAFVAHSPSVQAIGLVTFNNAVTVLVRPTTNRTRLTAALQSLPKLAEGTRLWDAASEAIDVLKQDRITAASVLLLTDGRDIGSHTTASDVSSKARAAGVRMFTVGLRSQQYTPGPLQQLASATHAAYAEASSAGQLATIYGSISAKLAREYLLRYRSLAGPAKKISVLVRVTGIPRSAGWTYLTPALPSHALPPFHRSFFDRFVSSPASIALLSLFAAVLAWFGVNVLLKPHRSTVRYRVGEFVGVGGTTSGTDEASQRVRERLLSHVLLVAEGAFRRAPWWQRFEDELEIAGFRVSAVPLATGTALASLVLLMFGFVSPVLALLAIAPPLVVRAMYKERLRKKRKAFEEQLPDNLTVLAASLRAGHSFVGGLNSVLDQAEEPTRSELRRAISDEQLGVPLEDALLRVAERMQSGDLEQVALVASLQRQTGGNTAEVLDAVVDTIRERFELRRLVTTLTAQGRLARWILTCLPLAVAGYLALVNPHYMSPLIDTTGGQVLLVLAIVMVIAGSYSVKKITDIEI
jgi:tight adherence protein B